MERTYGLRAGHRHWRRAHSRSSGTANEAIDVGQGHLRVREVRGVRERFELLMTVFCAASDGSWKSPDTDASTWKRLSPVVSNGWAPMSIGPLPPSRRSLISRMRVSSCLL